MQDLLSVKTFSNAVELAQRYMIEDVAAFLENLLCAAIAKNGSMGCGITLDFVGDDGSQFNSICEAAHISDLARLKNALFKLASSAETEHSKAIRKLWEARSFGPLVMQILNKAFESKDNGNQSSEQQTKK